jgi:hypothetical protein
MSNTTTQDQVPDELNPAYTFSGTRNAILLDMVSGKIDPVAMAAKELAGRGYDHSGKFVGFSHAEDIYFEFMMDRIPAPEDDEDEEGLFAIMGRIFNPEQP